MSDRVFNFNLPTAELEATFIAESNARGLSGLKGHRSIGGCGGCRASIYNAFPADCLKTKRTCSISLTPPLLER